MNPPRDHHIAAPENTNRQLPIVSDIDSLGDNALEKITHSLKISGGCVVRNMLDQDMLEDIEKEVRPYLNKAGPAPGTFWPPQTRKVMGCLGKSKTFAINLVGNELWQKVGEYFLTGKLEYNYVGNEASPAVSAPQVNNTVVFSIGPGAYAQKLHRDDPVHHNFHPAASTHSLGRDTAVGLFIAGTKSTRLNGATRFIPGSHLWDYSLPPPLSDDECFYAELNPGDGFIVLAGCYHGGSANTTADEERLLYSTFTTRGYLRQEENQYLANDIERIKELPVWLQRFAGYSLSRPFMGWVDMDDPMRVINPNYRTEGDLW